MSIYLHRPGCFIGMYYSSTVRKYFSNKSSVEKQLVLWLLQQPLIEHWT